MNKAGEIGFEQKERKDDVTYAASGKLSGVEETRQLEERPAKEQAGIDEMFSKCELKIIEKVTERGKAFF